VLAQATFSNETDAGWQQVDFATPVAITAGMTYVASYHTNTGHYAVGTGYFTSTGADKPPLHALQNGVSGGNGVYTYSATPTFPTQTYHAPNYWVDVVFSTSLTNGAAFAVPGRIQAEDYRSGGEGVGYHDLTPGNAGGAYRQDDVDIGACTDGTPCFYVGWFAPTEWLAYNVNVATNGNYVFQLRAATATSSATVHLELDGVNVTDSVIIPNTGGWDTWRTISTPPVSLSAGPHTLKLVTDQSYPNLNYLDVSPAP
jgi:hypothetical protein